MRGNITGFGSYPGVGEYYQTPTVGMGEYYQTRGYGVVPTGGQATALNEAIVWFKTQKTSTKVGFAIAGAAVVAGFFWGLALLISPKPKTGAGAYKANLRRKRRVSTQRRRARVSGKRARAPKGKIITIKGKRRFGHKLPPKKYWTMGARAKRDYAWPEGYKYPLVFRGPKGKVNVKKTKRHIASAKAYFKKSKHFYPPKVRRIIAKNINRASKRFNVGPALARA